MIKHLSESTLTRRSTTNTVYNSGSARIQSTPDLSGGVENSPISPVTPTPLDAHEPLPESQLHSSIDDQALIEVLENAAQTITPALDDLPTPLQERLEEWSALHGFDRIDETTAQRVVAQQAAFNLLLQTTLYEWHHQNGNLPALTTGTREALHHASEQTGNPAFEHYVLDELAWLGDAAALERVVNERYRLLRSAQPAVDIGRLYAALLPPETRRLLGQYRSPQRLGQVMRQWAITPGETLLDPGMGAGVLSAPASPDCEELSNPTHVLGIDRSQLAVRMGTTALTLSSQSHETRATDFLSLSVNELPTAVDAIVCNPPYTSREDLSSDAVETLNAQAEATTGLDIDTRSPLYTYFLYHSRQFLAPGDRAAFLTPQSYLACQYGESVKQFLLKHFAIKAVVLFDPAGEQVFDDAQTTGLLTFLEARDEQAPTDCTQFIRIDEMRDLSVVQTALQGGQQGQTEWGFINSVDQSQLDPGDNWQAQFHPTETETSHLPSLAEFVSVKRGPTTGSVDFFCLSQDDVDDLGIDEQHLSRLVRWGRDIHGYDYQERDWEDARANGNDVWLLDSDELENVPDAIETFKTQLCYGTTQPDDLDNTTDTQSALLRYLQAGVTEFGLNETAAVKNRTPWYRPDRRPPARVLVQPSSRDGFKFILNETAVKHTNALYGFYDITVSETELKALLAYLNSNVVNDVFRSHSHTRAGGFGKIEPNTLERVPVIDPREMTADTVSTLADQFDELRQTARHDGDWNAIIQQIDTVLRRTL